MKAPHFYKIILKGSLEDGNLVSIFNSVTLCVYVFIFILLYCILYVCKLNYRYFSSQRIPRGFIMKYGNGLSKEVVLKVPSGAEWKVELTKLDDDVCFQKGLREFMEYYSIKEFHFLLFRYDGNSHFYVVILDGTATEIDYPFNNSHGDQENMLDEEFEGLKVEETESDSSVEILGDFSSSCPKTRDKSPLLPFLQPHKMVKTHPSNKIGSTSNSETLVPCSPPKCTQPKMKKPKLEGMESYEFLSV